MHWGRPNFHPPPLHDHFAPQPLRPFPTIAPCNRPVPSTSFSSAAAGANTPSPGNSSNPPASASSGSHTPKTRASPPSAPPSTSQSKPNKHSAPNDSARRTTSASSSSAPKTPSQRASPTSSRAPRVRTASFLAPPRTPHDSNGTSP